MIENDELSASGIEGQGSWIITATGKKLFFLQPEFESLSIFDIVHCLGNLCRFTGATSQFYSVAQHSLFVGQLVKLTLDSENVSSESVEYWDQVLAALLHDSEEAYVNDLSSPLKSAIMGKYKWIATGIRRKIFEKYGIDWGYMNETVKDADKQAILVERYYLMPDHPDWPKVKKHEMEYVTPRKVNPIEASRELLQAIDYCIERRDVFRVEGAQEPV